LCHILNYFDVAAPAQPNPPQPPPPTQPAPVQPVVQFALVQPPSQQLVIDPALVFPPPSKTLQTNIKRDPFGMQLYQETSLEELGATALPTTSRPLLPPSLANRKVCLIYLAII